MTVLQIPSCYQCVHTIIVTRLWRSRLATWKVQYFYSVVSFLNLPSNIKDKHVLATSILFHLQSILISDNIYCTLIHERLSKQPFLLGRTNALGFVDDTFNIIEWTWGMTSASSRKLIHWKLPKRDLTDSHIITTDYYKTGRGSLTVFLTVPFNLVWTKTQLRSRQPVNFSIKLQLVFWLNWKKVP